MQSKKSLKAKKSRYNKAWYASNKEYKKLYMRMRYRSAFLDGYSFATAAIVSDRREQISAGRAVNEMTRKPYNVQRVCELAKAM